MTHNNLYTDLVNINGDEPGHEKMCLIAYANNKGAYSPCISAQSDQSLCRSLPSLFLFLLMTLVTVGYYL